MDKQDTKELSMDEILSSIRNILHDSGVRHQSKDDEYRAINISTMKTVAEPQPFVPLRPVVSEPQVSETTEEKNDTEYDVATICSNIQKMMLQAEEREEQSNNFRITTDDEEIYEPKDNLPTAKIALLEAYNIIIDNEVEFKSNYRDYYYDVVNNIELKITDGGKTR
jgi:cell pole-organizing protein PopZ